MTYPVVAIVNTLLDRAEKKKIDDMSPMKIQKLLYYAQAWYLKLHDKKPLIDEYFSRWKYGPVIPSLYHSLKKYGSNNAKLIADIDILEDKVKYSYPIIEDSSIIAFLDKILDEYGIYSGPTLSSMTHKEDTAWAYGINGKGSDGSVILFDDMKKDIE